MKKINEDTAFDSLWFSLKQAKKVAFSSGNYPVISFKNKSAKWLGTPSREVYQCDCDDISISFRLRDIDTFQVTTDYSLIVFFEDESELVLEGITYE